MLLKLKSNVIPWPIGSLKRSTITKKRSISSSNNLQSRTLQICCDKHWLRENRDLPSTFRGLGYLYSQHYFLKASRYLSIDSHLAFIAAVTFFSHLWTPKLSSVQGSCSRLNSWSGWAGLQPRAAQSSALWTHLNLVSSGHLYHPMRRLHLEVCSFNLLTNRQGVGY